MLVHDNCSPFGVPTLKLRLHSWPIKKYSRCSRNPPLASQERVRGFSSQLWRVLDDLGSTFQNFSPHSQRRKKGEVGMREKMPTTYLKQIAWPFRRTTSVKKHG